MKLKYKRCRPEKRIYRNLALGILVFLIIATVLPVAVHPADSLPHNTRQSTPNLLVTGKQLYDRGNLVAAADIWQQARREFTRDRNITAQIQSNNYLAVVYQDLGKWQQAQKAISENRALIAKSKQQVSPENTGNLALLEAQTLNTQGGWQLKRGEGETAFATWERAEAIYRALADKQGIALSQINQAQALQTLGFYRRSQDLLEEVAGELNALEDSSLKIAALRSLGVALEVAGDSQQGKEILQESLAIAKQINAREDAGLTLLSLGNNARSNEDIGNATTYYQQAISLASNPQTKLQANLNLLSLLVENDRLVTARNLIPAIASQLEQFPPSRGVIYAKVNFAKSLMALGEGNVGKLLSTAVTEASNLKDNIAKAHAVGQLGRWHEQNKNYDRALYLTNWGLSLADRVATTKISASLHWQQGRIFKAKGKVKNAIAAYEQAVADLDSLHQDLVAVNPNLQFSFRQQVEPIYRQLVELLLQDVDRLSPQQKQQHLESSRIAIEALQQKELENFFRIACLDVSEQNIDRLDADAAIIYPILLDDSVEVILSLPGEPLQHYRTAIARQEQTAVFKELLQYLNPVFSSTDILPTSQKIYDWLIRPAESALQKDAIDTLVFVLDGKLRSLPMNVLHDGNNYLIEKYNLALTPGLRLFPSSTLAKQNLKILTGGLTESRQGFSALPGVKEEIGNIKQTTTSQILLDSEFTNPKVQQRVEKEPFSIVHFATHGQFSSNAEDTFILTWDDRIKVKDFDRLLSHRGNDTPIELLVLSACKTARGDDLAILGLAGMAVRSGARSTLATLWSVGDRSTAELMSEFYRSLHQSQMTKARALRQAQLALLKNKKYQHPYYWSPFVLVGNWQ